MAGENNHFNALPKGYMLDSFRIIKVLGSGGFGIAYLAEDIHLEKVFVVKEYLPSDFSYREQSSNIVHPKDPSQKENYEWGLREFINEAKTIAKFEHPNIVQVTRYFEANNTAYIVMNYVKGCSLNELLKNGETATEEEMKAIVIPLLNGLKAVHSKNILHRDIKPSNIYISDQGNTPILIDFGAARYSLGSHSRSITTVITPGYSPYEQYQTRGNQGPWTDIYAMGAVMYRLLSGTMPQEAPSRVKNDPLIPATQLGRGKYSHQLLAAIDHALAFDEDDRPQSVEEWLSEIEGITTTAGASTAGASTAGASTAETSTAETSTAETSTAGASTAGASTAGISASGINQKNNNLPTFAWVIIVALVAGIAALAMKVFDQPDPYSNPSRDYSPPPSNTLTSEENTKSFVDKLKEKQKADEARRLEKEAEARRLEKEAEARRIAKEEDKDAAIRVVIKYYLYIALKDVDSLLGLWKDPYSEGAQKAKKILNAGGGTCKVLEGSRLKSYSEFFTKIYVRVDCDEGRRTKVYEVNFELEKVNSSWKIIRFYSD